MASDSSLAQMAEFKARMTPAELEAHEAFFRPFWNEAITILQAGFKSTQQATSPAPLSQSTQPSIQKKKRNEKTRRQYKRRTLQQANAKSTMEKESTPSSSDIIQISLLSTIPSQTIKQVMRESACNAPLFTCQYALLLAYQHGSSLLAFQPTFCLLALSPGYIEHTEDMEATGQG